MRGLGARLRFEHTWRRINSSTAPLATSRKPVHRTTIPSSSAAAQSLGINCPKHLGGRPQPGDKLSQALARPPKAPGQTSKALVKQRSRTLGRPPNGRGLGKTQVKREGPQQTLVKTQVPITWAAAETLGTTYNTSNTRGASNNSRKTQVPSTWAAAQVVGTAAAQSSGTKRPNLRD